MAVPIPVPNPADKFAFAQGKRYTFNIHFFSADKPGAGYVDPEAGSDLDGNTQTNDNGKKILGGEIKFDATVTDWDNNINNNIEIYL